MQRVACAWIILCFLIPNPFPLKAAKEQSWVEINSPHFTVFSDAGEKKARRITHEFEKFHAAIQQLFPLLQTSPSLPTIVLAVKDERALRSLLPEYWEERGLSHPSGIFIGGPEKNYIALRLDVAGEHRYHVVYHEYVHLLMRLNLPPLPTWLSEGLAECFGYTIISDRLSEIGRPSSEQLRILKSKQPIPLAELFAVDQESPYYREESKTSIFYAQSWALMHMFFMHEKGAHTQKLWKYLDLIQKNIPHDTAAVQAFGNLQLLERQLNNYIRQLAFHHFKVDTPSVADPKDHPARTVSQLEILAVHGDFYVATQRWVEAKTALDSVLQADPQNAAANTSMGLFYLRQNQREEANKHFLIAANSDSQSFISHFYTGIIAAQSGEHRKAETSYRQAVALNPQFAPAYSGLAGILAMKEETAEEALKLALQAVQMEPGVLSHQLALANTLMHLREVDLAIQYAERVEAAAESIEDRAEAKRFLSTARLYRDNLRESERINNEIAKQQELNRIERDRQEVRRLDYEEAERERQRVLKEREDAYNKLEEAEREYLKEVDAAKAKGSTSLDGIVSEANCLNSAILELTIEAKGGLHKFHSANYYKIQFMAIDHAPEGALNPCSDLTGLRVSVGFIATPGMVYTGEIQDLGIYKSK